MEPYRRFLPAGCFYGLLPCSEKPDDQLSNAGGKSHYDEADNHDDSDAEPTFGREEHACPRSQPTLKKRIDEAQAEAREGLFRWLIFLLAGGVGLAHFLY